MLKANYRLLMCSMILLVVLSSHGPCFGQDLSTDEGVASALGTVLKRVVKKESLCISRPQDLPTVVVVGHRVNDAGCLHDGVFVKGKFIDPNDARVGLQALGWSAAAKIYREHLALLWVENVLLAFGASVVTEKRFDDNQHISPPVARTGPDGTITLKLWLINAPRRGAVPNPTLRSPRYSLVKYRFRKDGRLVDEN